MFIVSDDGYIRLSLSAALDISLVHLLSGLDEEFHAGVAGVADAARVCQISGYTEWISTTQPAVSLGWDWNLVMNGDRPRYERSGVPRSNMMLVDELSRDLGTEVSTMLIESIVDAMEWQNETAREILERYS